MFREQTKTYAFRNYWKQNFLKIHSYVKPFYFYFNIIIHRLF